MMPKLDAADPAAHTPNAEGDEMTPIHLLWAKTDYAPRAARHLLSFERASMTPAEEEFKILRSQFVTSSPWGGRRYRPYAFTEQEVAMLSGILNSPYAVRVNIAIMRAFVRLRQVIAAHRQLAEKLPELEKKIGTHDRQIAAVFEALRRLMAPPEEKQRKPIGFKVREKSSSYRISRKGRA